MVMTSINNPVSSFQDVINDTNNYSGIYESRMLISLFNYTYRFIIK
jgi:hypothetical protein